MKTIIIPEACKGDSPKYSGTVEMRPPFIEERWAYLEECGLLPQDDATEVKEQSGLAMSKTLVKVLMPKLPNHVVKVDLTEIATGTKLESLDSLRADPDASNILIELVAMLLRGFKPGKNL